MVSGEGRRTEKPVEIGTRENALYTLVNIDTAISQLREVRRHVRGDHKHRIDDVMVILNVISHEAKKTYAIPDDEAEEFVRKNRARLPL
jgi:hypothetical protein